MADVRDILRAERSKVGTIRLQKGKSDELRIKLSNPTEIGTGISLLKALAKPVSSVGGIGKLDLDVVSEDDEIIVRLSDAERRAQTIGQCSKLWKSFAGVLMKWERVSRLYKDKVLKEF